MKTFPAVLAALAAAFASCLALAAGNPAPAGPPELKGEVLEVIDVEAYTYLRLKTSTGEKWAAVSRAPVKKGTQVTIFDPAEMRDFESKSLKRTFPTIYFGAVGVAAGEVPAGSSDPHRMHGGQTAPSTGKDAKVAKAEGANARTVAEIHAAGNAIKDKPVRVRAKVTKVAPNIMGKNWVHLRDGSGSAADDTNDILVTTQAETKVGEVVVATGVVRTDVNLGSGYVYKVLVENASIAR